MKKIKLIVILLFVIILRSQSQIETGVIDLSGGLQMGFLKAKDYLKNNNDPINFTASAPVFFVGADFGLSDRIALQVQMSFGSYSYDLHRVVAGPPLNFHYKMSSLGVLTGCKYYLPIELPKIYPYVNGQVQIFVLNHTEQDTYTDGKGVEVETYSGSNTSPKFYIGIYAGARYDINDRFFAFGEVGLGWSLVNAGVQYRIKK